MKQQTLDCRLILVRQMSLICSIKADSSQKKQEVSMMYSSPIWAASFLQQAAQMMQQVRLAKPGIISSH